MLSHTSQPTARQQGLSVVELLIALTISLILISGMLTFYINYNKNAFDLAKTVRLEQELRSTLDFMARDIKRAGFWADAHTNIGNASYCHSGYSDCDGSSAGRFNISQDASRLDYAYDQNQDGDVEQYSFFLDNGGVFYAYPGGTDSGADLITEPNNTVYTNLQFDWEDRTVTGPAGSLEIRELVMTATARLRTDDDNLARSVTKTVRIRNDEYQEPAP